ncbi:hypothetical protein BC937DRAFT_94258, partial [Endogone sp. FLAS-F59071]
RDLIGLFPSRQPCIQLIRFNESRSTRFYVLCCLAQAIICTVLEALILAAHSAESGYVYNTDYSTFRSPTANSSYSMPGGQDPFQYPEDRLTRLKYENMFFMVFQVFQCYLGIDAVGIEMARGFFWVLERWALDGLGWFDVRIYRSEYDIDLIFSVVRQNLIQLIAHVVITLLCVIFAIVQITETTKWYNIVNNIDIANNVTTVLTGFDNAWSYEIGLTAALAVFTLAFAALAWRLGRQFGWNIYKRIGADLQMQNAYRLYQIFTLLLKLDAFFEFVFAVFWLAVMAESGYATLKDPVLVAIFIVHAILCVLNIPALFLARRAVRTESAPLVAFFLFFLSVLIVDFCVIIQQSNTQWGFWVFAVCVAIALGLVTFFYTIIVTGNFNKGLKPHIQRLFDENYRLYIDPTTNPNLKSPTAAGVGSEPWTIDDIETGNSRPVSRVGSLWRNGRVEAGRSASRKSRRLEGERKWDLEMEDVVEGTGGTGRADEADGADMAELGLERGEAA